MKKHLVGFLFAIFAFASFVIPVEAQKGTYAVTNVEIITVSGSAISSGTVVIRDGLIESVGSNVKIPADAKVLDGKGLTIYPGFIDTNSDVGIAATGSQPRQQSGPAAPASNSSYPLSLRPDKFVIEDLKAGDDSFKSHRDAGITTVVTTHSNRIFNGHSAVINLTGDSVAEIVIKSPFAQSIAFNTDRGGGFPRSLLGTFAAMRQMFNDAKRLDEIKTKFAANPKGMRRPVANPELEALIPVLKGQIPVVIFADTEREIIRALDLTKEYGLTTIIAGGLESGKVASRLKSQNVPVLLTLNFPERTVAEHKDQDPEPLHLLRLRVEARKNAAMLKNSGVKFAFQSGGMKNIKDYSKNAGIAVKNGLPANDAVRAMTLTAAEILGVDSQLGSIERGKIANLVVMKGKLFEEDAVRTHVFVDGVLFEQPKKKDIPKTGAGNTDTANAAGVWNVTVEAPGISIPLTITLEQSGDSLTGTLGSDQFGGSDITNGKATADGFEFDATVNFGGQTINLSFAGTVDGDDVEGTVTTDQGPATFSGSRTP